MLALEGLGAAYGKVQVLRDLDLRVGAGEVLALLGRNGAGKTTTLKAVMGLVRRTAGSLRCDGAEISGLPAHAVAALGIAYVPQGRGLFPDLSVRENLQMGLLARGRGAAARDRALATFPALGERLGQAAGTLSGGEQQMLALARALCMEPKVLLLDEPSEGLMPSVVARILEVVRELRESGVAVLLVEQRIEAALAVADRVAFIEHGTVCAGALPAALAADPEPLHRYLGVRA